jgi:hypothetical protein
VPGLQKTRARVNVSRENARNLGLFGDGRCVCLGGGTGLYHHAACDHAVCRPDPGPYAAEVLRGP